MLEDLKALHDITHGLTMLSTLELMVSMLKRDYMNCLHWGPLLTEKYEALSTNALFVCLEVRDALTACSRTLVLFYNEIGEECKLPMNSMLSNADIVVFWFGYPSCRLLSHTSN